MVRINGEDKALAGINLLEYLNISVQGVQTR